MITFVAGVLITIVCVFLSISMLAVIMRMKRKKRSETAENIYNYPQDLPTQELTDNPAYGNLEAVIPGKLGVFVAPSTRPNVSYGVLDPHATSDVDGYELIDTLNSGEYEEPQYSTLTMF